MTGAGFYFLGLMIGFIVGICFIKLAKNKVFDKINGFFEKFGK